jgi:hypothetical protein
MARGCRLGTLFARLALIALAACQAPATVTDLPRTGSDRDSRGCIPSAGYLWDEVQRKCNRPWENPINPGSEKN